MLHRGSGERFADLSEERFALLAVRGCRFDLDQFMAVQVRVDLFEHGCRQPFVADHHDRVEGVGKGLELLALGGGQLHDERTHGDRREQAF